MSLLYEDVFPVQTQPKNQYVRRYQLSKSFKVHDNWEVKIPILWGCNADSKPYNVPWDSTKTTITKAELYVKAFSNSYDSYMDYFFNGQKIVAFVWSTVKDVWKEDRKDVTGYLLNGENTFKAEFCKSMPKLFEVSCWVTAILTYWYTGETPTPPSPPPKPEEKILQYAMYAGIAAIAVIGGVMIVRVVTKKG